MNQRYHSLDVFRGATVALMILVNNPGSWSHIYAPLEHAPWHGCTPTDLVFPFFLFAVGNALSFVLPGFKQGGHEKFLKKVFKRSALIFGIGLFLNWFPFVRWDDDQLVSRSFSSLRFLGVLQRIALCYLLAALIAYYLTRKQAIVAVIFILVVYWLLSRYLGYPADPYSLEGFWGTHLDRSVLGSNHMYKGEGVAFDPEGLASTIAAIVNVIFGYLVGQLIQAKGKTFDMLTQLLVWGAVLTFAGFCWDLVFPINKKIWSSSYVLYTTGLATTVLAVLIYVIEFGKNRGSWTRFFDVFGKNALFIFVLSGLLPRLLALIRIPDIGGEKGKFTYLTPFGWFYNYVCAPLFENPKNSSLFYALCMITLYWFVAYMMDRRKIYIKV